MPVILNGRRSAFTQIDVSVANNVGGPSFIGVILNSAPETNRQLKAIAYLYRRVVDPSIIEFYPIERLECWQRRNGLRLAYSLNSTDIVRIVTLYDFVQVICVVQNIS